MLTLGIGAGIATAMAKYSPKDTNAPHIILIGRNRQSADAVIESMKNVNSAGKYEFVQGDLTLMKGVRSVAAEIAGKVEKINFLCMSPGIFSLKAKDETEEGIDRKLALHFYSRFPPPPPSFLPLNTLLNCKASSLQTFYSQNWRKQQTKVRMPECYLCWRLEKEEPST
jgi:NAD(P)-dependent dehydrogenase (short-subunit alcohol dehydrogenase family)